MTEIANWHDTESPLRIEYSTDVMERIRQRALEGLKALPRTGLAVGGLLLGERAGAKVRILDTAELPCSHAFGPTFLLTPHEKAQGREFVETVEDLAVVGWYCSRPRGEIQLADADLALYRELFPAQWQITLLLQARLEGPARAAFFFTSESGELRKGAERDLAAWVPRLNPLELSLKDMAPLPPLEPAMPGEPADTVEITENPEKESPVRGPKQGATRGRGTGWVISWVLTAIAALAVGAAVFEVQNTWLTESPVQTPAPAQVP